MSEWKPIESAPKDGTPFLVCWESADDKWVMTTAAWWQPSNGNADLGFWDLVESGTYADDSEVVPEYWMPLPAPPTPSVQETDDGRE